jgi:hypothetical protein
MPPTIIGHGFRCSTFFSRLTKYPLLFENLAKYTEEDSEELISVLRAVERSKEILNHVNQAVREAEDIQRLSDIQRRLDKSGFEKVEHPMAGEFKVCINLLYICSQLNIPEQGPTVRLMEQQHIFCPLL